MSSYLTLMSLSLSLSLSLSHTHTHNSNDRVFLPISLKENSSNTLHDNSKDYSLVVLVIWLT